MSEWTRSRFYNEYIPGLAAVGVDSYMTNLNQAKWSKLVTTKTSAKGKEENAIRSSLGLPRVKGEGGPVTYDVQIAGPKQSWVHTVYALAVRLTEEAIDDNLYELKGGGNSEGLPDMMKDLGRSFAYNEEYLASRFFNSGAATTYHTTRFGSTYPLFYTAHKRLDGSTYSNKATDTDLTYLTFWSALIAAENQTDHRQIKVDKKVTTLWVPAAYERKAREILDSPDRPDTANRAVSAYAKSGRNIKLEVWREMSDADMWVLQLEGDGIIKYQNRKTRFGREIDFATGDTMIKGDQRFSMEINDERCFYGVVPA